MKLIAINKKHRLEIKKAGTLFFLYQDGLLLKKSSAAKIRELFNKIVLGEK